MIWFLIKKIKLEFSLFLCEKSNIKKSFLNQILFKMKKDE